MRKLRAHASNLPGVVWRGPQNRARTINWICRGNPVPVLGEAALSLLLLKFTVELITPKFCGAVRLVTVFPIIAPGA